MKISLSFFAVFLFVVASYSQSRTVSKDEYEKVHGFAVEKTNGDYPVIYKVTITSTESGKSVRTVTQINENESQGHERIKMTEVADGRETNKYQIMVGFGNVFCSKDGVSWDPPTEYMCFGPDSISRGRDPESTEYGVTKKSLNGKKVMVYRKYSVFAPSNGSNKKEFEESVSTIDSRGFFITVVNTEGTLDPKMVTLTIKESWVTKAKIKPIVAPG